MLNDLLFWCKPHQRESNSVSKVVCEKDGSSVLSWGEHAYMRYSFNGKFDHESIISLHDNSFHILAGVLFHKEEGFSDCIYTDIGIQYECLYDWLSRIRGCFCGIVADFQNNEIAFYSDHLANMPLYYYHDESFFCCGSSVFAIAEELVKLGKLDVSLAGAYSLVSYAYMLHDYTLFEGIRRVLPGSVGRVKLCGEQSNSIEWNRYYVIDNTPEPCSLDDAVDSVDALFHQALIRQIMVNERNGYEHLCALSAGLDSRMTAFTLHSITEAPITIYTYSQLLQNDFKIPMQICHDNSWKWLFKNLDGGCDLLRIDQSIKISNGTNYYPWASQLTEFLDCVNLHRFGLVHTGVLGDVILGTFCDVDHIDSSYKLGDGAYSFKLIHRLKEMGQSLALPGYDYERGMLYNRGINGAALGYSLSFNEHAVAFSPFMDIDFFNYCLHLPIELRLDHFLYYAWVTRRNGKAAKYPHNEIAIPTKTASIQWNRHRIPIQQVPGILGSKLKAKKAQNSMNPFDWWYATNSQLRIALDTYYIEHRDVLSFDETLTYDVDELYIAGNAIEKTMCISLVGSLAKFF